MTAMSKKVKAAEETNLTAEETNLTADEMAAAFETAVMPKPKKARPVRTYTWSGNQPQEVKGQAVTVLEALKAVRAGVLEDFVAWIQEAAPTYKTKTPLDDSVKFHLHQFARSGYVTEADQAAQ
jgi:hypothetical protein